MTSPTSASHAPPSFDTDSRQNTIAQLFGRVVSIEPGEARATLLACLFFFCLLASYYVLRSIRDALGVQAGVGVLPWIFSGTLITTLLLNPVFGSVVARLPVRRFIPIVYHAFGVCLLGFAAALRWLPASSERYLAPLFIIWTSVFNLFVVSVFWGFMSDTFRSEQGKRLYGFIGVGGTIGALAGSGITALLAKHVGTSLLLLISALLLEMSIQCVRVFPPSFRQDTREREDAHQPIGGGSLSGITNVLRSPYMLGICLYMLMFTIGTTVLYFQQAEIVKAEFSDRASRTAFLAQLDFAVQVLTVLAQLFVTGRVIKWLGVGVTLAVLPLMSVIGFTALGIKTTVAMFVVFSTLRRAGNYGLASPGREVLFTVVSAEDKYKAKNLIDTFAYRSGDQIGAWSYAGLSSLGLAVGTISLLAAPMSLVWMGVALWLGKRHSDMMSREERVTFPRPPSVVPTSVVSH